MIDGTDQISGHQTLLSEGRADDLKAAPGDTIDVEFPGGKTIPLEVVGVFEDTPTTGGITFPLSVLADAGIKRSDSTLSITLADGADRASVKQDLEDVVKDLPILAVQDKEEFKELISGQVNQLLYVIYGLLALAVVIAVIGIVNTLGLSVLERTREIGLLRAVGLSRRKLRTMITLESVAIALLGAVLGMVRRAGHRRRAAPVAEGRPHRALAAAQQPGRLPRRRRHLRRAGGDRARDPRLADEGAGGHRDGVSSDQ